MNVLSVYPSRGVFFPLNFPVLAVGGFRLDVGPPWTCLCNCPNSALKPRIVLASSRDELCDASTRWFAFNPGRIKVLQFPRRSFCSRFSHRAALSLCCSCSLLSEGAGSCLIAECCEAKLASQGADSKSQQERAVRVAGADFLLSVPSLEQDGGSRCKGEHCSVPCFLRNPRREGKYCWFLSLPAIPVDAAFRHDLGKGQRPMAAKPARV